MTHLVDYRDQPSPVWVLELNTDRPPLTLNMRLHYRQEAERKGKLRALVHGLAIELGIGPMVRPAVQLVWLVTTRHARDADNLVPVLKAACDGLVDAGVTDDDTPALMHKPTPIIAYAKGHPKAPGLFLVLWEQEGPTEEETRAAAALDAPVGVYA